MVSAGVADEMLVQLSYAIGVAEPVSVFVDTFGSAKLDHDDSYIAKMIRDIFTLTPYEIEERLKLRYPIYFETARYGHLGRTPKTVKKHFLSPYNGEIEQEVELFTWEKLDYVDTIKKAFKLK
jgi:S-adenosylmethionine synthetase